MLPTTKHTLDTVDINDIISSLQRALATNFAESSVELVDCPDLTQSPWCMACPGLSGSPRVCDIGGVPNLIPLVDTSKVYTYSDIAECCELPQALIVGASAGDSNLQGVNCELMNNAKVGGNNNSKYALIQGDQYKLGDYKHQSLGLLGNLFLSQGLPGKVLKVTAFKRKGTLNFVSCMNQGLGKDIEHPVALGGVFLLKEGKARIHVMPGFSKCPLNTDEDVYNWLTFHEMSAPLTNVSVLISKDPGLDLRLEHSHCFSEHGEGGHYHYDVTPDIVRYEGYFNVAEFIFRVDPPEVTHLVGRD